eukprot:CAMPEP_0180768742 /NCGR_PEP_ID=MMETSP1038_2-20121128/40731_1 /TAXON_ID=632150 /ORGANISM="Azadinium spinosum, Strain 3D9" /LENGTH=118 /DNA_ID=CAMNT_0022803421 /DNA_START=244 /DNA_END=601 /DNA_ORIENTATION=+
MTGACALELSIPALKVVVAWTVLTASRSSAICDPALLAVPWLTSGLGDPVPMSMRHLAGHWLRLGARRRWQRIQTLVLFGLFRLAMMNGINRPAPAKESELLSLELDETTIALADGAL